MPFHSTIYPDADPELQPSGRLRLWFLIVKQWLFVNLSKECRSKYLALGFEKPGHVAKRKRLDSTTQY